MSPFTRSPRPATRAAAIAAAALALSIAGLGPASAAPGGRPAIPLNNGQESPGARLGASGFFSYEIDGSSLCYELSARRLTGPATGAHIHLGERNVAGGVVVPLSVGSSTTWTVATCTTADPALLAAIAENPRDYYVNVHTEAFPGGEIRGQLK